MICWLYQMSIKSEKGWSHDEYEKDVCEGYLTSLSVCTIRPKGLKPQKGDMLVPFFAWARDPKGGICGWGEVTEYNEEEDLLYFEPKEPSDHLKMKPILNDTVKDITKRIRNGFFQGNMWEIPTDLLIPIRQMIEQV